MRNGAYSLAFLAAIGGLALLMTAGPNDRLYTSLGSLLLVGTFALIGLGKVLVFLGYVRDGAAPDDPESTSH